MRVVLLSIVGIFLLLCTHIFAQVNLSVTVSLSSLQCSDGIDNDGDTKVDYPFDTGCDSINDDSENYEGTPPPPGGGGGGGGGGGAPPGVPAGQVFFRGKAYPGSDVTLLKDAAVVGTTRAVVNGDFELTLSNITPGTYVFSVWAEDIKGVRSATHTFTIVVGTGAGTVVNGIFLPPTISSDKQEVKRGDPIVFLGQSAPNASLLLRINSEHEVIKNVSADANGLWNFNFKSDEVELGDHVARSRASLDNDVSIFSTALSFKVGNKNVLAPLPTKKFLNVDLNKDGKVNLVDYSILAYWYKRVSPPATVDFDSNGKVDLGDFSIMAYYWTG
jgi:hypothetical protein